MGRGLAGPRRADTAGHTRAAAPASPATGTGPAAAATTCARRRRSTQGETITIGYVNNEERRFSLPEFRIGGEVAVDAINKAGGVNGATIKLVECNADGTPEGSVNCANKFVDAKVTWPTPASTWARTPCSRC